MAAMALDEAGLGRIGEAVRAAEAGTAAEIVVVVEAHRRREGDVPAWPALAALAAPVPLLLLAPRLGGLTLYTAELAVLAACLLPLAFPALGARLTPKAARERRLLGLARDQFFERGLHMTAARTGVLLLVSPADRCARIVCDAGVGGPVPDEAWRPALDGLAAEARAGRLVEGVEAALKGIGDTLRARLPAAGPGDVNEVPDRPAVI